jgi:xylulokinase
LEVHGTPIPEYTKPGWAEQKAEDWWKAVVKTTKETMKTTGISSGNIIAISSSEHQAGCLPVDLEGKPLRHQ